MRWSLKDLEEWLLIGSTLVEGSTLSEAEARDVLAGRSVSGHPAHEARELLNYRAGTGWLIEQLERSPYLSLDLVLDFHRRLFDGSGDHAGRLKTRHNYTVRSDGTRHEFLHPALITDALLAWLERYNADATGEAATMGAMLYRDFQQIHPFEDGNGRIGRILLAYWLHWKHSLAFKFVAADRVEHLRAIEATNVHDVGPLTAFISARIVMEE